MHFFNSFYDIATQDIKINSKIDGANNRSNVAETLSYRKGEVCIIY